MPLDIRVIAFDLDGTLLNSEKEITPRVREAVRRAAAAGITVLPATGRPLSNIDAAVLGLPGVRYALISNGAQILDLQTGQSLYSDCFTADEALPLLLVAAEDADIVSVYANGKAYTDNPHLEAMRPLIPAAFLSAIWSSRTRVPSLLDFLLQEKPQVEKLAMMYAKPEARQAALQKLNAGPFHACITASLEYNLEVNTATCNKGVSLLALAKHLGYTREQVMALGDAENDAEMLRAAGYSVAMGNAEPAIKALADSITAGCDEDGAALAIEAILPPGA